MNGIDRVIALRAEILQRTAVARPAAPDAEHSGFAATLDRALDATSIQAAQATKLAEAYERGETNDLAAVMVERQKASLAFQATLQTRNKLLSAYRDIMNMPV